jgi:hypothetical protein
MPVKRLHLENEQTGYLVDETGRIYSEKTKKFLKPFLWQSKSNAKYYVYCLSHKNIKFKLSAHRAVAICFIENPENKKQVNHIDGDGLNNHFSNLEWCSASENSKHAFRTGLRKTNKTYSKLKPEDFDIIRKLAKTMKQVDLLKIYNIDQGYMSKIINNKR